MSINTSSTKIVDIAKLNVSIWFEPIIISICFVCLGQKNN
jgi:hypothetical protein